MTYKKSILFFLILISINAVSQNNQSDKELLDSIKKSDELINALDGPESYFKANLAIGNQLYSLHNRALNALQTNKELIFTPSIGYYHKSGLSLAFAGYLLKDSAKTNFYQYSLTPSYDYENGKNVNAGISFTRYFVSKNYKGNSSPIQNDLYAYLNFKKPWLKPGLAVGYSSGKSKDINLVTVTLPALGKKTFPDTATTTLKEFTLTGSLEHTFDFYGLISTKDLLSFTPGLMINGGSSKEEVTHQNMYSAKIQNKKKLRGTNSITPFELQSVGLNFDVNYSVGKFEFSPELYLDYYIPATTDKRFTQVFSINVGYTF